MNNDTRSDTVTGTLNSALSRISLTIKPVISLLHQIYKFISLFGWRLGLHLCTAIALTASLLVCLCIAIYVLAYNVPVLVSANLQRVPWHLLLRHDLKGWLRIVSVK